MSDFIRVKVEVYANGEATDFTIEDPIQVGQLIPVQVAVTAAETAARANALRSLRSSSKLVPRTGHVLDRR